MSRHSLVRLCSLVFAVFMFGVSWSSCDLRVVAADSPKPIRIVLTGDSTVAPKSGWGSGFEARLQPGATCTNMALGGRSSKSFRDEGQWVKVLALKPDYILIQFGHNDMPGKGPQRETDPKTTFPDNLRRFVDEAKAIGAQPILITSMARRTFQDGKIRGELAPWADAAKTVAKEKNVPLVDLFTRSIEVLEKLGPEGSAVFDPPSSKGRPDHTHLSRKGAQDMSGLVADELKEVAPELGKFLKP